MSLAIPSSYNEYLFDQVTRQHVPQMLCNGGLILRRSAGAQLSASTNWTYCLRGEDVFFLLEGAYSRATLNDLDYLQVLGSGMDNTIRASRLQSIRDAIRNNRNNWQQAELTIPSHDFGSTPPDDSQNEVENWMLQNVGGIGDGLQFVTFSTGDYLDAGRMRRLMLELRKMNYSVDATHMLVVSWDTEHTIHAERQEGQQHSQDDYAGMGLWFSERSQFGYYSNLNFDLDAESVENTLNVDLWVDQQDAWTVVADYWTYGLVHVENVWSWNNSTTGESYGGTPDEHYVLVPLASQYMTIAGGGAHFQARSPTDIIDEAYDVAGLQRYADQIQFQVAPNKNGNWGTELLSQASIVGTYNLVHFKYCSP